MAPPPVLTGTLFLGLTRNLTVSRLATVTVYIYICMHSVCTCVIPVFTPTGPKLYRLTWAEQQNTDPVEHFCYNRVASNVGNICMWSIHTYKT